MKIRSLLAIAALAALAFTACEEQENLGEAQITVTPSSINGSRYFFLNFEAFIIPNLLRISDADTAVCISFITPSTWSRLSPDLVPTWSQLSPCDSTSFTLSL